jgi:hypothetical protein
MTVDEWALPLIIAATAVAVVPAVVEAVRLRRAEKLAPQRPDLDPKTPLDLNVVTEQVVKAERRRTEQEAPLVLNPDFPLRIVLGKLPPPEPLRNAVAQEDVDAALTILSLSDIREGTNPITTADKIEKPCRDNLVLIGSDLRNPMTGDVLSHPKTIKFLNCRFVRQAPLPGEQKERLSIQLESRVYESPMYEQARRYARKPRDYDAEFSDLGLLAKVPNPWNPVTGVLIVAGISALGTEGVAVYLTEHPEWLALNMKKKYFAVIVRATRESTRKDIVTAELEPLYDAFALEAG